MEQEATTVAAPLHLLLIPYPDQGHLIPALDFARAISASQGVSVTVVLTAPGSASSNPQIPSIDSSCSATINILILPFPPLPKETDVFRRSFTQVMYAMADLHGPILEWARAQPNPPDAVVSDMFVGWTNRLAAELGVPRLVLCTAGAFAYLAINFLWREMPHRRGGNSEGDGESWPVTFTVIPGSPTLPWRQISTVYRSYREGDPVSEFILEGFRENARSWGLIVNTFENLESKYLEGLKQFLGHSCIWSVGPLALCASNNTSTLSKRGGPSTTPVEELLRWLDTCPDCSVVYVSFGSEIVLDPPQMEAVAAALELSGLRFVWCTRTTEKVGGGAGVVPLGFEERTGDRGMVVRGWAPQVAVLAHPAVGSFLSHCGWNSSVEAIAAGVVVLTWPMGADQFYNARLIVDDLQVGVRASEGEAVPDPIELAAVFTHSLGPARAAERERVRALKDRAAEAWKEDGTSCRDMHALVKALREHRHAQAGCERDNGGKHFPS